MGQCSISYRTRECWEAVSRYWEALHVERHGKYSVARLHSLKAHSERTSLFRATLVIFFTPLPCLVTTILVDLIPLQPPERGLAHSQMFWVRALYTCWLISFAMLDQSRHYIARLPIASVRVVPAATFLTVGVVVIGFAISYTVGFPVPFYPVAISPGWVFGFALSILVVRKDHFRQDPRLSRELAYYVLVVIVQVSMTLVYPAYIFLYQQLSGFPQVVFALLLSQVKLVFKNILKYFLRNREDAKPEFIIFNAEVFHALYVACCMQNATGYVATIMLIVMDFGFAVLSLRSMFAVIREFEVEVFEKPGNLQESNERQELTSSSKTEMRTIWSKMRHVEAAIFLLENDPKLLKESLVRVRSLAQCQQNSQTQPDALVSTRSGSAASEYQPAPSDGSRCIGTDLHNNHPVAPPGREKPGKYIVKTAARTHLFVRGPRVAHFAKEDETQTPIQPQPSMPELLSSVVSDRHRIPRILPETLVLTSRLTDDEKRAVLALSDSCRARYVQHVLHLLHWTEFLLLVEYVEVMILIVYCECQPSPIWQ